MDYSVFKPFNAQDYFHRLCFISDYNNQTNVEDCWLGDNTVSLPDLNTTRPEVKTMWYDWVGSLVSNYSGMYCTVFTVYSLPLHAALTDIKSTASA